MDVAGDTDFVGPDDHRNALNLSAVIGAMFIKLHMDSPSRSTEERHPKVLAAQERVSHSVDRNLAVPPIDLGFSTAGFPLLFYQKPP